jgi:RNA polymerase sigma factor (sigma-70 family)
LKDFVMRTALALTNIAAAPLFGENRELAHFERARTVIHFNEQDRRLPAMMTTAQGGSRSAFENLVRAATPFIKSVARRLGVPADFIDDVVQETLLTIHCIRHTFDPNRPFTPWLRMIAQRRAIDVLRRHIRTVGREIHEPLAFQNYSDPAGNPEEAMDQSDRKSALHLSDRRLAGETTRSGGAACAQWQIARGCIRDNRTDARCAEGELSSCARHVARESKTHFCEVEGVTANAFNAKSNSR